MAHLTDELVARRQWSDVDVRASGFEVIDVPFVSIGGGYGSFALVDLLRISGTPTTSIAVLTRNTYPHETYQYLARNSQIRDRDRLRSDSSAMPDNAWGFPSYAIIEAAKGNRDAAWTVLTEPLLKEFYTPISGDVFRATITEADRIGWHDMIRKAQARLIRLRTGGGYFTVATETSRHTKRRIIYRSRYVHLALGYAGAQFLPDLQDYRERTGDITRVANAYENHEHVYAEASRRPTTIVLRGSGIVASRILERLLTEAETGNPVRVIHLFRRFPIESTTRPRPRVVRGFTLQPFNLAKSAFGGGLAEQYEKIADPEERTRAIRASAGTTTAYRAAWFDQIERCSKSGAYSQQQGEVEKVEGSDSGLRLEVSNGDATTFIDADFILDATGLQGGASDHRVLNDLIEVVGVGLNPMRRIEASKTFEIESAASAPGRMFITGAMSMGNYFGPVDSFYGLQYAAWRVLDQMAADGFQPRLGARLSVRGWIRRMRGRAP